MIHPSIKPHHMQRHAYVYLRQSSPGQVRKNREGRLRQQAMVDRVATLGWPGSHIVLLENDTAKSGSSLHGRKDFHLLLDAIMTHKAGLVAARELSRLVRDNQDWAHLVRICHFEDVLMADENRVYDPADPQDRMVLGIQGAFNEFEVSMILERMQQSLRQKGLRGEQYDGLPPGYIWRQGTLCEKHPDLRVQRAIEKVLADFEHFPSVRQLYQQLEAEEFGFPVVAPGADWRDVTWRTPSYSQLLALLKHPAYAGIYVRGRRKSYTMLDEHGHKQTKRRCVPRDQWEVFLVDHHEAYISRETWEQNVKKISANTRGGQGKGAAGEGQSLMAGLLRCKRCGHRLRTRYPASGVYYVCHGGEKQRTRGAEKCMTFYGADLEALLAEEILEVVGSAGVEASQRAAEHLASQFQRQRQVLVDLLDASREVAARAGREYHRTDNAYAAVRQVLAAEWEAALADVADKEARLVAYDERQPQVPTSCQREQLACLGQDVRQLWNHPRVSNSLKQQLVRVLITEIVADVDEEQDETILWIQWSGGHHTQLRGKRTRRHTQVSSQQLNTIIETLRKVQSDKAIASVLNREGIRTYRNKNWSAKLVRRHRERAGISAYHAKRKAESGWLTQAETATRLEISPMSVHRLVCNHILPAEQPQRGMPMVILATDLNLPDVQQAVEALRAGKNCPLPEDPQQLKLF